MLKYHNFGREIFTSLDKKFVISSLLDIRFLDILQYT